MPRPYTVALPQARTAFLAELDNFMATVTALDDLTLLGPSRAFGWSRLDCLVHVRIGLQELLAGIPAQTDSAPDVDAASYWTAWEAQADEDPVPGIMYTRRAASAGARPRHALEHLHQVARGLRELVARMPDTPVRFQGHTISAGDLMATWAVEVALHHHDLDAPQHPAITAEARRIGRRTAVALRDDLPASDDDLLLLLKAFGRA